MSHAWVLAGSPLPPPAIRWEMRGGGRASASSGASDLAASFLLGVRVAGSSHSQESLGLADPSLVDSCLCRR